MRHYNPDDRIDLTPEGRQTVQPLPQEPTEEKPLNALTGQIIYEIYQKLRKERLGRSGVRWEYVPAPRQDFFNLFAIDLNKQMAQAILEAQKVLQ